MSQTVARAIRIMKYVAETPRSLGEVAEFVDTHKSTALRVLQTLEEGGFTRRMPDGKHGLGLAIIPLGQRAVDQIDIRTLAHPHLQRLMEEVGHTIHLGQLIDDEVVYVDKIEGLGTVAMGSRIGLSAESYTAGVAKVILAYLSEERLANAIKHTSFTRYTPTTIPNEEAFRRELEVTRQRGWAEDNGEKEDYINCVALPIFDSGGRVSLGMSVTALRAAARLAELRGKMPQFRRVAFAISQELGWKGDEYGRR